MKLDQALTPDWSQGHSFHLAPDRQSHVLRCPKGIVRLNQSAGQISTLIDGRATIGEIVAALQKRFPNLPEMDVDVDAFIRAARKRQWIELY